MIKPTKRTDYLVNYIANLCVGGKNPPSPLLLKGPDGSGKSWVSSLLHQKLKKESAIICVWAPFQLSGENLVANISELIAREERKLMGDASMSEIKKKKVLVFVERIDRLFNLLGKERINELPRRAKGVGAAYFSQTQHASELRSFLIENRTRVSAITTSNADTRFMDDPDQPFFNFFNVIEVKPLSPDESREYLFSAVATNERANQMLTVLESFSISAVDYLTEGIISNLNLLIAALIENSDSTPKNDIKILGQIFSSYFHKVAPYMESKIERLSYSERALVDSVIRLPIQFRPRDISSKESNLSRSLANLRAKGFVEPTVPSSTSYFKLSSTLFRSWLRYQTFHSVEEVFR